MDLSGVNAPNSAENHKQRIRQPSIANRLRSDVRHARPVIKETYLKTEVEDVPKNTKHIQFLQKGTKVLLKSYTFVKNLGEGGFGEVKEYIDDTTQKHVALKRVKCNTEEAFGNAYREIEALKGMTHDFIVKIFDAYWDSKYCYYTMPVYGRGNLEALLKQYRNENKFLSPQIISLIIVQLASAIQFLHSMPFIHRDISANNVMIDVLDEEKGIVRVVLVDFGAGQGVDSKSTVAFTRGGVGKQYYMAPEQGGESKNFSVAVDIWSLGIVFCQLLTHKDEQYLFNFNAPVSIANAHALKDENEVLIQIEKNILSTETSTYSVNHGHISLVCSMLRKSSKDRATAQQVLDRSIFALYQVFTKFYNPNTFTPTTFYPIMGLPISLLVIILDSDYFPLKESNIFQLMEKMQKDEAEKLFEKLRMPLLEISFLFENVRPLIGTSKILYDRYYELIEYNAFGVMFLEKNGIRGEKRFKDRIPYPKATLFSATQDAPNKFTTFKFQTYQPDSATLLYNGRAVEKLTHNHMDGFIFGDTPLMNDDVSVYCWEIRLEKIGFDPAGIIIGAWTQRLENVGGDKIPECYGVSMSGKISRGFGTMPMKEEVVKTFKQDDVCTVIVDFARSEISFERNGVHLVVLPLLQARCVYPCVFLCYKGDKVSVLEAPAEKKKKAKLFEFIKN